MKHLLAMALLGTFLAIPAQAQTPNLKIAVPPADPGVETEVYSALIPLIVENPHFTLVSNGTWDVALRFSCVKTSVDGAVNGIACSYSLEYGPDINMGATTYLTSGVVVAGTVDGATREINTSLIEAVTPDALKKVDDILNKLVRHIATSGGQYYRDHPAELDTDSGIKPKTSAPVPAKPGCKKTSATCLPT
jgi:hypothetical protein